MILTDREIQIALSRKQIIIDPLPQAIAYSSTSVDLTLDPILNVFKTGTPAVKKIIDPTIPDHNVDEILAEITATHTIDRSRPEWWCNSAEQAASERAIQSAVVSERLAVGHR